MRRRLGLDEALDDEEAVAAKSRDLVAGRLVDKKHRVPRISWLGFGVSLARGYRRASSLGLLPINASNRLDPGAEMPR